MYMYEYLYMYMSMYNAYMLKIGGLTKPLEIHSAPILPTTMEAHFLKDQRSMMYAGMTDVALVWHFWQKYFPV